MAKVTKNHLLEMEALRTRLQEAEETIQAIRKGEVDAIVVSGPQGDQVFTLEGADHPYRVFVEVMSEGAATLGSDGAILFSNNKLSELLITPIEKVIGSSIFQFIEATQIRIFETAFQKGRQGDSRVETFLKRADGTAVAVHISFSPLRSDESICTMIITDLTERKKAEDALRHSQGQLRALSSQLFTIQEDERRRIARDLHDGLQQALTAIKFKVESFLQNTGEDNDDLNLQPLKSIVPIVQECVREMSRIQTNLRPSVLDDLGVLSGISYLARRVEEMVSGICIDKRFAIGESEIPESLKTVIYRVTQEMMNNVLKHSRADHVEISFQKTDGRIELSIHDNGEGFDTKKMRSDGVGLISIRERAENSGGAFQIESAPGKGTLVTVSWPIWDTGEVK